MFVKCQLEGLRWVRFDVKFGCSFPTVVPDRELCQQLSRKCGMPTTVLPAQDSNYVLAFEAAVDVHFDVFLCCPRAALDYRRGAAALQPGRLVYAAELPRKQDRRLAAPVASIIASRPCGIIDATKATGQG